MWDSSRHSFASWLRKMYPSKSNSGSPLDDLDSLWLQLDGYGMQWFLLSENEFISIFIRFTHVLELSLFWKGSSRWKKREHMFMLCRCRGQRIVDLTCLIASEVRLVTTLLHWSQVVRLKQRSLVGFVLKWVGSWKLRGTAPESKVSWISSDAFGWQTSGAL